MTQITDEYLFDLSIKNYDPDKFKLSKEQFWALRSRSDEFVFIIGSARSATTIIAESLNIANDVIVLYEDNAFLNFYMEDYISWYCKMTAESGEKVAKGFHLPRHCCTKMNWAETYLMLKSTYRLVGGKIALGPHGYWPDVDKNLIEFYLSIFPNSTYIGSIRQPIECLNSMSTMFSAKDFVELFEAWVLSTLYVVYFAALTERFYLVPFDRLGPRYVRALLRDSGLMDVDLSELVIKVLRSNEPVSFDRLAERLRKEFKTKEEIKYINNLLLDASSIYTEVGDNFDHSNGSYNKHGSAAQFSNRVAGRLKKLLADLKGMPRQSVAHSSPTRARKQ